MENIIEIKQLTKSYAGHPVLLDINLEVRNGEILTLLGPSGCGKTTLLRLISGFEDPNEGEIFIAGKNVARLAPNLRHVNTVFQNYALFPHMTVFENVSFGLRCQKLPEDEIRHRVNEALAIVKLTGFEQRRPAQLSGGQQQRVAIARAVVNQPLVLLFDEPLSSLDYRLRKNMQLELRQLQRKLGISFIFVTHDQEEALSMSDRVAIMQHGRIVQQGTPREVYEHPSNLAVAKFIGEVNIFDLEILQANDDEILVNLDGLDLNLNNQAGFEVGDKIHVIVRPEDCRVLDRTEVEDPDSMLSGRVEEVIYKGSTVDLMVRLNSGRLIHATEFFDEEDEDLAYTIGESVWIDWMLGWEVILPYEKG
ncbi:MAG: spermidine/putrescine ABC transporter ATP-binding protein PotA [Legionellales bacterium]|nr:spermidine/putrescine ABC transporter ATP-binding protein PotA [Legionellales bacterium]